MPGLLVLGFCLNILLWGPLALKKTLLQPGSGYVSGCIFPHCCCRYRGEKVAESTGRFWHTGFFIGFADVILEALHSFVEMAEIHVEVD